MTAQQLLDAVNAAGVTESEITTILTGGKITVQAARLRSQAAKLRSDAATGVSDAETQAQTLEAQARQITEGLAG